MVLQSMEQSKLDKCETVLTQNLCQNSIERQDLNFALGLCLCKLIMTVKIEEMEIWDRKNGVKDFRF